MPRGPPSTPLSTLRRTAVQHGSEKATEAEHAAENLLSTRAGRQDRVFRCPRAQDGSLRSSRRWSYQRCPCAPLSNMSEETNLIISHLCLDFYNWNKVYVRYCDGASFSGDTEGWAQDGSILHFRGLHIYEAVIDELMRKGLANATQALLTGCSAGGLATILHCDDFSARFPREVSVKCLADAGFFLDVKDISGVRSFWSVYDGVVHLQNVREVLPKECLANKEPTECFFPAELIKSIRTPMFILNSGYDSWQIQNVLVPVSSSPDKSWLSCKNNIRNCNSTQIQVLDGFRNSMVNNLKVVEDKGDWGMFIDSCFTHCQTLYGISWNSPISPRLGNNTIAEAVGDWYSRRRQEVKQIDCEYPCNPTCSSLLPT